MTKMMKGQPSYAEKARPTKIALHLHKSILIVAVAA